MAHSCPDRPGRQASCSRTALAVVRHVSRGPTMLKASSRLLAVAIGLMAATRSASAQPAPVEPAGPGLDIGLGIRGGVSVDADAFYGGVHGNIDGIGGTA